MDADTNFSRPYGMFEMLKYYVKTGKTPPPGNVGYTMPSTYAVHLKLKCVSVLCCVGKCFIIMA